MIDRKAGRAAPHGVPPKSVASRLLHCMLVTLGLRSDPRHAAIRASTLAMLFCIMFALLGVIRHFSTAEVLAHSPFKFDLALRAVSKGWLVSDRTIPITIVDIDDATHRAWGSPAATPREPLTRILELVAAARPAAVVTDIDLSFSVGEPGQPDAGTRRLRQFLESYAGPAPLIFPKRLEPAPAGTRALTSSPFDDVFERNSRLAWAHAAFETGSGGAVRSWRDWLEVCVDSRTAWVPSVETSLAAQLPELPIGLDRPAPPSAARRDCSGTHDSSGHEQRLLIGPRMTGDNRPARRPDVQTVSAGLVLDPQLARDDARLFGGRVVFIGATHLGAGDFWLTPSGVLPGVELLANTVRYAALQRETPGVGVRVLHRALTLALFAFFIYVDRRLRGLVALFVTTLGTLLVVAFGLAVFEDLGVLDAVEAAILLVIACKALDTVLGFIADLKSKRGHGWWQTMKAACLRENGAPHS